MDGASEAYLVALDTARDVDRQLPAVFDLVALLPACIHPSRSKQNKNPGNERTVQAVQRRESVGWKNAGEFTAYHESSTALRCRNRRQFKDGFSGT